LVLLAGALCVCAPAQAQVDFTKLDSTFSENFTHFAASASGTLAGRPVWQTRFKGGLRTLANNHEAEWYGDFGTGRPFQVKNGMLEITAFPAAGLPGGALFSSGLITTEQSFTQTYGYFEIRAELPQGQGFWPAFWLLPADGSWPPEIDAMEMLGGDTNDYYASVHAVAGAQRIDEITKIAAPDLSAGYHVFGVSWRPDHVKFYLDGALVHEVVTPPGMDTPMYLLANLAVGAEGSWPGAAALDATGVYRIAWIHAWQFDDILKKK